MSVSSHFPGPPDLRMPRNPIGAEKLGIRFKGPILTGALGVREAFRKQAYELCGPRESYLPDMGRDVQAGPEPLRGQPPNAADALYSVDPVMAYERSRHGPLPSTTYHSPEQYDPVLRSHLGMKPAPDPYEEERLRRAYWDQIRPLGR